VFQEKMSDVSDSEIMKEMESFSGDDDAEEKE
jgi:hypothetical protein